LALLKDVPVSLFAVYGFLFLVLVVGRFVVWDGRGARSKELFTSWVGLRKHYGRRCRVDVSPTDVSPIENSWMLRPLNKASLGYCVPDRCVPTLDRIKQDPRQLYACPLGTDETCPTYPDIKSADTHRPHHPCTASRMDHTTHGCRVREVGLN